jgi:hypothetical protein
MPEYDDFPANKVTAPQTIEVQVIEKEDDVLKYTQGKRQVIVESLMRKELDNLNNAQISLLTASLDGMDRSALGRKRLQTDEKIGASQAMAAALISRVLATPGALQAGQAVGARQSIAVPGEMDSDAPQMDYNTFMAQSSEKSD